MLRTTKDWAREFDRYPEDTIVGVIGGEIAFETPDGDPAVPLFTWVDDYLGWNVGDYVRKPDYPDTGTVELVDLGFGKSRPPMLFVRWEQTGSSWEYGNLVGRVNP